MSFLAKTWQEMNKTDVPCFRCLDLGELSKSAPIHKAVGRPTPDAAILGVGVLYAVFNSGLAMVVILVYIAQHEQIRSKSIGSRP